MLKELLFVYERLNDELKHLVLKEVVSYGKSVHINIEHPNYTKFTSLLSKNPSRILTESNPRYKYVPNLFLPKLHTSIITSILQPLHKIKSFLRFQILTSLLFSVQHSISLKF